MDITCDQLTTFLFAKADINKIPLAGSFELTSRCTLDCKMCYIHKRSSDKSAIAEEKDAKFWIDLAAKARDSGMLMLLLTGGEPLLRSDFDEIYTECKKLGLLVSVNTNATLLNEDKIRLFTEYPPQKISITLYGASPETYGKLCGNASAYQKVTDSIRKLKNAGVNIKLNYSITPDNVEDIPAVTAFAKELDVPVKAASYMFSPTRTCGETFRLTPEEAAKAKLDWQRNMFGDEETKRILIKSDAIPESNDISCSQRINCRAGLSTFWVTWKGEMTPCGMMSGPNVPIQDFTQAWKKICEERDKIFLPKECSTCLLRKKCDMCAAVSMAECGKSDSVPPYACQKAHEFQKICNEFISRQ